MSAPETNVEKQTKRHKPALIGLAIAIVVFALLAFGLAEWSQEAVDPSDTAAPAVAGQTD